MNNLTEKEKFFAWLEEERKRGLLSIYLTPNYENTQKCSEEDIYRELNAMINAPAIEDAELFPNRLDPPPYTFD